MTKTKRDNITIVYGDDYAIIKGRLTSDMKTLVKILMGICPNAIAISTIASIMESMAEIIRGSSNVVDFETGDSESIISVHVDTCDVIVTFTGFEIKPEKV